MASRGKTDRECLSEEVRRTAEERQGAIRYGCARFLSLFISCDVFMNILYIGVQHSETTLEIWKYFCFENKQNERILTKTKESL